MRLLWKSGGCVVACCLSVVACSSGDPVDEGTAGAGGKGADASIEASVPCESSASGVDLTGLWAAYVDLSLLLRTQTGGVVTLCPDDQISSATMVLLFDAKASQAPSKIDTFQPVLCSLNLPTLDAVVGECPNPPSNQLDMQLPFPTILTQSLGAIPVGAVAASVDGAGSFKSDPFVLSIGSRNPGDQMPTWNAAQAGCGMSAIGKGNSGTCEQDCVSDCGGLVDDDGDLFPGVTTYVCGYSAIDVQKKTKCQAEAPTEGGTTVQGKLFFNFRIEPTLTGTAKSSCEVAGHVSSGVKYEVVGADVAVANSLVSVSAAKKSLPFFDVTTDQSRFRMIRVDGKHGGPNWQIASLGDPKAACAVALAHLNELN